MTVDDRRNILSQALLGTVDSGRQAWLAERRTGIGGSEAAAVLGLSKFDTPVTVWMNKTGRSAPKKTTLRMAFGSINEEDVADMYTIVTGRKVQRYNRMVHRGCLLGNFDRLVIPDGAKVAAHMGEVRTDTLLECKCSDSDWGGEVPLYYQIQVQHYMGLEPRLLHADVACYFRMKDEFRVFRVERDDKTIAYMQERLAEWWDRHVVHDRIPEPVNGADCRLLWERSTKGSKVTATAEIKEKLDGFNALKLAERNAKKEAELLKNDIEAFMKDNEVLVDAAGKPLATWRSGAEKTVTAVDWELVAKSLGATPEALNAAIDRFTTTETKVGDRRFLAK